MDEQLVLKSIEKGAELALYSARLAMKSSALSHRAGEVNRDIVKAYGKLEALVALVRRLGLDGSPLMETVRASMNRVEAIHTEFCQHHGLVHGHHKVEEVA